MTDPMAYSSFMNATTTVLHSIWQSSPSSLDAHGNAVTVYADPVERIALAIYPLHMLPHADPVDANYAARYIADFVMEVPDASLYSKNDQVTWNNDVFIVENYPFNYGGNNPFGFDKTFFGGSVYIRRVS